MTPPRNKWLVFSIVATGVFMSTLDSSMLNIALPTIMGHFQSSLKHTEWVVMIYLLTVASTLLLWGHLGDILGRGRLYAAGMLLFAVGSMACAASSGLGMLIFFRFCQAVGASMMMALGPAIIKTTFPTNQLGRSFGLIGISVSLGLMAGPSLGGLLLEIGSWRLLFLITVPVGMLFSLLAIMILPAENNGQAWNSFDWTGGFLMTAALVFFTLGINQATASSLSGPTLFTWFFLAVLAGAWFLKREKQSSSPLLPVGLLRQRFFYAALLCAILSFEILFTVVVLTPFFLAHILALPNWQIGLTMMAIPVTILVVAPISGRLSDHLGARVLTTAGLLLSTTGLIFLAAMPAAISPVNVAWRLALLGGGQAMFLAPNSASVLKRVRDNQAGIAGALLATARNFGMLLGAAQTFFIFSLVFGWQTGLDMRDFTPAHTPAFMDGLEAAFFTAAAFGVLASSLSWWLRGRGDG